MDDPSASKVWFVTGASAGLGRAMVEHALEQGSKVVATCRKPETLSLLVSQYPSSQLIVVPLDVTSPTAIAAAFSQATDVFGRVDVVYNNAGYVILSEIEGTPDESARAQFEVNFWGSANVTREAVRVFRDVNRPPGGRLLQASSLGGIQAAPALGYYCASKFALEGLSEALQKEVDPSWNIKLTIIQLGGFATRVFTAESMTTIPQHPAYVKSDNQSRLFREYVAPDGLVHSNVGDPKKAAREMFKIAADENVGLRVALGLDAIGFAKGKLEEYEQIVELSPKWCADLN